MDKNMGRRQAPLKKAPSETSRILHLDLETRSRADLPDVGAHRYARDESTEVLCAAYAVDDEPVQLWLPGEPVPAEFAGADDWIVTAHNAAFERVIARHVLTPRHGWPEIPLTRWCCTMARTYACALPGKLENVAAALELQHQKDPEGAQLIRLLSKPRKNGTWNEDPELLSRLYAYCKRDVETERDLHRALPPLTEDEQLLWQIDQIINDRGFCTDGALLEAAARVVEESESRLLAEFNQLTGLNSPDQVAKLIGWLAGHGCEVSDLQKRTVSHALRRKGLPPEVRRAIEIRRELAHAGAAKVEALRAWCNDDGRVRGTLTYHGAATGRWVGRGPQPQNFKRSAGNIDAKIAAVLAGGDGLESPIEAVANITRAMVAAAPGHRFMGADYSGIESRVLAWISGQQSKIDAWATFDRTGDPADDPYVRIAQRCGLTSEARDTGKVIDLAFGFGGGVGAWKRTAPEDDETDEATAKRYQQTWRAEHPETVKFWYALDRAAISAVRSPGQEFPVGRVSFRYDAPYLRLTLPSGRAISYPFARIDGWDKRGNSKLTFLDNAGGKFTECRFGQGAWFGMLVENVVQGIARDLLAAALIRLEAAGYHIVLHVHDEIIAEVPDGFGSLEEFRNIVETPPAWAEGLPIRAKARESLRFSKEDAAPRASCSSSPSNDAAVGAELDQDHIHDDREHGADLRHDACATVTEPRVVDVDDAAGVVTAAEPQEDNFAILGRQPSPQSNGGGVSYGGNGRAREDAGRNRDGYPHGERDEGDKAGPRAVYIYRDARGRPYLGVKRTSGKQFPQFHWDGARWLKGKPKGPKIPYRLPELLDASIDDWVLICSGEKDAGTAAELGFVATTNSEGEGPGKWTPDLNAWFAGRKHIAVMEDNDETGRAHALEVVGAMRGIGVPDIRVIAFHELKEHGDLTDWIEQGHHGKEDLRARIEAAPPAEESELNEWDAGDLLCSGLPTPRRWLYGRQLCRRFLSSLVAPGDAGKTTMRLTQAIELATGRELLGHRIYERCRVLVISLEDDREELWRRLLAICKHHAVDPAALKDWLFCRDLVNAKLAEQVNGKRQLGTLEPMLRKTIERRRPGLVVLDPFVKLHALEENANADMDFVCAQLINLAQDYDIAIDSPAHTRKGQLAAGDADNRRGASAQRDAGRLDYTLTAMSEEEAKRFSMDPEERKGYVRLDRAKANIVRAIKATWYQLVNVPLGNATALYPEGDEVQAIEIWTPPEIWSGFSVEVLNAILDDIDAGLPDGNRFTDAPKAGDREAWRPIVKRRPDKTEAQAREIIRVWVQNGTLERREYANPKTRKPVKGLYVNPTMRPT